MTRLEEMKDFVFSKFNEKMKYIDDKIDANTERDKKQDIKILDLFEKHEKLMLRNNDKLKESLLK